MKKKIYFMLHTLPKTIISKIIYPPLDIELHIIREYRVDIADISSYYNLSLSEEYH